MNEEDFRNKYLPKFESKRTVVAKKEVESQEQIILSKMVAGKWYSANDLGCGLGILDSMFRKGLVNRNSKTDRFEARINVLWTKVETK